MELPATKQEKIKLTEINQYLTCYLCKGYLIDATTISECLHSFCRSCIIKFLQDNSYCPVCELIINKAKPNLKLDKTLQDIVYKLVPELFLKEMLRRKTYYKDYPQIAARVSPEERGEDTERTIFNPQEMISLSLEYICDDSTPGAIRIPEIATDPEMLKNNGSTEESQESQMKRYLLCPGMCRIEVLKKFVRNKYNVDTSQFFIDLLYKRVPLPDHYTLIDIAYIYSWQRNELMKFFFRIIDRNKAKRTDSPESNTPKFLPRHFCRTKSNGEKTSVASKRKESASEKKSHRKSVGKTNNGAAKHSSPNEKKPVKICHNKISNISNSVASESGLIGEHSESTQIRNIETKIENLEKPVNKKSAKSEPCKEINPNETEKRPKVDRCKKAVEKESDSIYTFSESDADDLRVNETDNECAVDSDNKLGKENVKESDVPKYKNCDSNKVVIKKTEKKICETKDNSIAKTESPCAIKESDMKTEPIKTEIKTEPVKAVIKMEPVSPEAHPEKTEGKLILKVSKDLLGEPNVLPSKAHNFAKPITKSYTSITLNRSENVEIITKIEPVANRDGKPIGHHIIKQTIKKGQKLKSNSPKKVSGKVGQVTIPRLVISKKTVKKKPAIKNVVNASQPSNPQNLDPAIINQQNSESINPEQTQVDIEDEKSKFLKCVELTPTSSLQVKNESSPPSLQPPKKQLIISRIAGGQKRKSTSPVKNCKAKIPKIENKRPVKIILHEKPNSTKLSAPLPGNQTDIKRDNGLQSLISNCKIPSSLSITIKESSENDRLPPVAPPVKNFIEILKLPDESSGSSDKDKVENSDNKPKELTQLDISKFCDNDSEQKVDQDLSEIAKSLTEKIPMSTTISQIVGPKQQFQIPVKTNIPQQFQIQPSPVPELNKAIAVPSKDNLVKLNPRSPQTFQKIFEESLKKPPEGPKTSAVEIGPNDPNTTPSTSKRNILEIASQLFKKTKLEQDKNQADLKKEEVALPKVPIPRLPNPRTPKLGLKKFEPDQINKLVPQTIASLHSSSLGMNYTVSVNQQSPSKTTKVNGIVSPVKAESVPKVPECKPSVSPLNELKSITTDFKVPSPSLGSPKLPEVSSASSLSPRQKTPSPKHSPKSSPLVKHMYAPTVPVFNPKIPSPMNRFASLSPKSSNIDRPFNTSPRHPSVSPKPVNISPKLPIPTSKAPQAASSSSTPNGNPSTLSPNDILEKYNIQNLAQLTANFNLSPSLLANNRLAAFQHAMLLKHFEMQNRHNWLNRNQGPLLQYEKYLQSLNGGLNGSQSNL